MLATRGRRPDVYYLALRVQHPGRAGCTAQTPCSTAPGCFDAAPVPAPHARPACRSAPVALKTSRRSAERQAGGRIADYETLIYEQDEHVVTLTYNRPDQHNAVNRKMNAELHDAWQRFRDDDDAFVLVITGAGETTFCAGWDLADAAVADRDAGLRRVPRLRLQLARATAATRAGPTSSSR